MNKLVFVVLDGKYMNLTIASIRFDQHGDLTQVPIIRCASWEEGFISADSQGYSHAIFVMAGTVFYNLKDFIHLISHYPHKGLIGHITDPLTAEEPFFLHPQCFLLELSKFAVDDFIIKDFESPIPVRSDKDIHHNYTPLWLRPSASNNLYTGKNFGERILAKHLMQGNIPVNWNSTLRALKQHLYTPEHVAEYLVAQQDYFNIAENQLWVFNNEEFVINIDHTKIVCPASGLYWILHLLNDKIETIDLVDISRPQLNLAKELLSTWNGVNYGQFVYNFMKYHNIKHFNLDNPTISKLERIQLMKQSVFVTTVNKIFENQCAEFGITNFAELWQESKLKPVTFNNNDIVDFLKTATGEFSLWMSNILDYKYTILKHSIEELDEYDHYTKNK